MARKFMKYVEEITGVAACGTTTNDIATFAKPIGSPIRKSFPSSILSMDPIESITKKKYQKINRANKN